MTLISPTAANSDRFPHHWAMDGVFPGAFETWQGDQWKNRLAFIAAHGFHGTSVGRQAVFDTEKRAFLEQLHRKQGLCFGVHLSIDYHEERGAGKKRLEEEVHELCEIQQSVPMFSDIGLVLAGDGHRFDRDVPVGQQLDILSDQLRSAAALAAAAELPLVVENHADYYISDLVSLCKRVPGLGIQLDTGNCFLIGERPDLIPDAAFPFVQATHWKDHYVHPNARELRFELTGATLGQGHVGLHGMYERLLRLHPDPASVRMRVEWVPDPDRDPWNCFDDSLAHLREISDGHFSGRINKEWNKKA